MIEQYALWAAILSAVSTAIAAWLSWHTPRATAKLAEALRRDSERSHEKQKSKLHVFSTLMQERAAVYSKDGVQALNLIDVVFNDSRTVREAWAELYLIFSTDPLPPHVLEERLRKLLSAMAKDIGLADELRTDDLGRIYTPRVLQQERLIRDMQQQALWQSLQQSSSPAANGTTTANDGWPPAPHREDA